MLSIRNPKNPMTAAVLEPLAANLLRPGSPLRCRLRLAVVTAVIALVASGPAADALAQADAPAEPRYPIGVAADDQTLYVVDLELPGVWKVTDDQREVFIRGSNRLRQPLNRPRCIAVHPQGGVLVGDSATRDVYHVAGRDAEPKPLSNGRIGIPMALAVSPDGLTLYVADAEQKSVLRLPIGGGQPESVVAVNARGLAFDGDGALWAVTPDNDAVRRIDVDAKSQQPVVGGRPYQYPNGLAWVGDYGLVTDGYGRSLWKFTPDGTTEIWFKGAPLVGPVGIASGERSVWVADPRAGEVLRFDKAAGKLLRGPGERERP